MSKSPNYMSRNGWTPDIIVFHVCEGTYNGSISWLTNKDSGVSSHYVTSKNGEITQLVDLDKAAWCNGTSTVEGAKYDYRRATNSLVRQRKTNANYYTISIENEGYSYKDNYGKLTEKQYQAVLNLCKTLIEKYNIPIDRNHLIGHNEIVPKEKPNCPGPKFEWDRLIKDLKEYNKKNNDNIILKVQKEYNNKFGNNLGYIDEDGIVGNDTKKHLIMAVQKEMNIQYKSKLSIDGIFGSKSKSAFKNLKKGVSGNITWICQAFLYIKNYDPNGLDSIYGPGMKKCVEKFQKNNNLSIDGILGKNTAYTLFN